MNTLLSNRESNSTQDPQSQLGDDRLAALTASQQQAMEWLLNGGTVTDAAQFAGVGRQAVSKWLHQDGPFKELYETWRAECAALTQARLLALGESAMDNIIDAVKNRHDLKASTFVIKSLSGLRKA